MISVPERRSRRLTLEITVIVLVKMVLLVIAWQLWFSDPVAHHMRVEAQRITQQFFALPTVHPFPAAGASHDPP